MQLSYNSNYRISVNVDPINKWTWSVVFVNEKWQHSVSWSVSIDKSLDNFAVS